MICQRMCLVLLGVFLFACGGPEGLRPPPKLETSFAQYPNGNIKVLVKTAPGAQVRFSPSYQSEWPREKRVRADASGMVEFNAGRMPYGKAKATVIVRASENNSKQALSRLEVSRPAELVQSLGDGLECRARRCRVMGQRGGRFSVDGEEGLTVSVAGKSVTVGKQRAWIEFGELALIEGIPLSQIFAKGNNVIKSFPVVVRFADGETLTGQYQLKSDRVREIIGKMFAKASSGPIQVPGVGNGSAAIRPAGRSTQLYGDAKTLADIRYIVVYEGATRKASCGTYYQKGTSKIRKIYRHYEDERVKLIDRRTGTVHKQKLFRAPSISCPRKARGSVRSTIDFRRVETWVRRNS